MTLRYTFSRFSYFCLLTFTGFIFSSLVFISGCQSASSNQIDLTETQKSPALQAGEAEAIFAGGCFWCTEADFEKIAGVSSVVSGYTGGSEINPNYKAVSSGQTSHREAVRVRYQPTQVSYDTLLDVYWRSIDLGDLNGQFADQGKQYRPAVITKDKKQYRLALASRSRLSRQLTKEIKIPIVNYKNFYLAEDYHQDYFKKEPQRYKAYRQGSGRSPYLKKTWGDERSPKGLRKLSDYRKRLEEISPLAQKVTQHEATETPFSHAYNDIKHKTRPGIFVDTLSGEPLFSTHDKFDSKTGWPSFTKPLVAQNIDLKLDKKLGATRVEVRSRFARSHLGHVFSDGPKPTHLRYCINGSALEFISKEQLLARGYGAFLHYF